MRSPTVAARLAGLEAELGELHESHADREADLRRVLDDLGLAADCVVFHSTAGGGGVLDPDFGDFGQLEGFAPRSRVTH